MYKTSVLFLCCMVVGHITPTKGQCSLPVSLQNQYFRSFTGLASWPFSESAGQFFTDYVTYDALTPATFMGESPPRYDCKQKVVIIICLTTSPAGVSKGSISIRPSNSEDPDLCDICKMHDGVPGDSDYHILVLNPTEIPTTTPEVPSPVPTVGCGIPPECPGFNEDAQCVMDMPPTPIEIFCQFFLDNLEVTMGNKRGVQVRGQHVLKDLMTRHRKNWGKKGKRGKRNGIIGNQNLNLNLNLILLKRMYVHVQNLMS